MYWICRSNILLSRLWSPIIEADQTKMKAKLTRSNEKMKPRNKTGATRPRNCRSGLNNIARAFGFVSWSAYETAVLNKSADLGLEKLDSKGTRRVKHIHGMITLKFLRNVYASELLAARPARSIDVQYFAGLCFGMESAFWAIERAIKHPENQSNSNGV
jgi:hypothetical protein